MALGQTKTERVETPAPPKNLRLPDFAEWLAAKEDDEDERDDRRRPRDLTEGERKIFGHLSKCVAKLKTCRADLGECQGNLVDTEAQLVKCQMQGPVVKHEVPYWFWLGGGAAVVISAIAGAVVASAL